MIGAIYDDGVGAGDVYAVLDDGGRNENVIYVVDEVEHYLLHLFLVHLTVPDRQACLRPATLYARCDRLDRLDAIVNEEDLPAAREPEFDGGLDQAVGKLYHLRLYCKSIAQ